MVALALIGRLRLAAILMSHMLIVTVTLSSLSDVPSAEVSRSIHLNMLAVAAASYFLLYREGFYLRIVLPTLALVIFCAFSLDLNVLNHLGFEGTPGRHKIGVLVNHLTGIGGAAVSIVLMQSNLVGRRTFVADVRRGLLRGEFHLQFQPQVGEDRQILGVEALLRWTHPERGQISPADFIPLAEEEGLIVPIGEWVLRTACAQLERWSHDPATAHLTMAVNVSAIQFRQDDFVRQVISIVNSSGARPSRLKLELTESALAEDWTRVIAKMEALRAESITWSLDDFGTGYSSLSSLKRFPFDQIKIDQSFVRDLIADPRNMAIVKTIVDLARSLDLNIIAEGVETEEQLDALKSAGCLFYQGYLISRPLSLVDLSALLDHQSGSYRDEALDIAARRIGADRTF